jgi:micrococcal nuclease
VTRGSRTAVFWIGLFVALAIAGSRIDFSRDGHERRERSSQPGSTGVVVHVVDGDTVDVRMGDGTRRVRYIGVDTPESVKPDTPVQCFAEQASAYNKRLVSGKRVRLVYGPDRFDRYGRVLAYVYLPGSPRSVNAQLVATGFARVLAIAPNTAHLRPYLRLEREARQRGLGLWGSCDYRPEF